jgi:hypothetical protein
VSQGADGTQGGRSKRKTRWIVAGILGALVLVPVVMSLPGILYRRRERAAARHVEALCGFCERKSVGRAECAHRSGHAGPTAVRGCEGRSTIGRAPGGVGCGLVAGSGARARRRPGRHSPRRLVRTASMPGGGRPFPRSRGRGVGPPLTRPAHRRSPQGRPERHNGAAFAHMSGRRELPGGRFSPRIGGRTRSSVVCFKGLAVRMSPT